VLVTLSEEGMLLHVTGSDPVHVPAFPVKVRDVSGAGDTVVAALALALSTGADHVSAVTLANKAASVVVGKFGTATVTPEEILQDTDAVRLVSRRSLGPLAATLRAKGRKIVTINGSFDLLHAGHLFILSQARQQGDVLIVGLNSDASVKGYKGDGRPLISERQRAEMLLALRTVDYVHVFDEPNPIAFLNEVKPDVHVNGAEYGADCIESEAVRMNGGRIHLVERIPNLSTSNLVTALRGTAAAS